MAKNILNPFKISIFISIFLISLSACKDKNNTENRDAEVEKVEEVSPQNSNESVEENAEQLVDLKDQSKLNPAQIQVQKLLQSCVKNNYEAAAKTIMYRGKDEKRVGVDSFNYLNANEANTVKITCEVLKGWLGESKNYEFISYQEVETDYGPQHVVEIMFKKEKLGVNRHFFYLVDSPKGMLLVNML